MRDAQNPYPLNVWLALDQYILSVLQANNNTVHGSGNGTDNMTGTSDHRGAVTGRYCCCGTFHTKRVVSRMVLHHDLFVPIQRFLPFPSVFSIETRGGRYGMAKRLKSNGPEVFRRYSLGQVCHIVQLAVHLGMLPKTMNIQSDNSLIDITHCV